jgi:hypothetical protein
MPLPSSCHMTMSWRHWSTTQSTSPETSEVRDLPQSQRCQSEMECIPKKPGKHMDPSKKFDIFITHSLGERLQNEHTMGKLQLSIHIFHAWNCSTDFDEVSTHGLQWNLLPKFNLVHTNSTEKSYSLEYDAHSARQKMSYSLQNRSLELDPILSQTNPIHNLFPYLHLNFIPLSMPRSSNGIFPWESIPKSMNITKINLKMITSRCLHHSLRCWQHRK